MSLKNGDVDFTLAYMQSTVCMCVFLLFDFDKYFVYTTCKYLHKSFLLKPRCRDIGFEIHF